MTITKMGRPATAEVTPARIRKRKMDRLRYYSTESLLQWARHAVQNARKRAKRRGWAFDLKVEDILPLAKVTTHCPILGVELEYQRGRGVNSPRGAAASIDRVDNSRGYFPGAVRIISTKANTVKGNCSLQDLMKLGSYAASLLHRPGRWVA